MKIGLDTNISAEGIKMRLIEKSDSKFIIDIRTNSKLGQNISWTSSCIETQINWIEEYKKREAEQKEFYFIFEDSNGKPWGTVRLYNLTENCFTVGSWICLPHNKDKIAIKAWLLCVEFGFENLGLKVCEFDVRKKNISVLYYAYLYKPIVIKEDELNYFFTLDKEKFYKNREKIIQLLNLKM